MRGAVGCICPDAFPEVKTVPGVLQIRQEVLSVKKFVAALLTLAVMVCTASFCFAEAQLPYELTASIGCVTTDPVKRPDMRLKDYVREADELMYRIKKIVHGEG